MTASMRPLRENRRHGDFLFPVSAYENTVEEHIRIPLPYHWHPETELFFVLSGRTDFQVEGEPLVLEAGDVLLIKPNVLHGAHDFPGEKLVFRAVVFDYSFLAGIGNDRIEQNYLRPLLLEEDSRYLLFSGCQGASRELFDLLNRIYGLFESREKGYEILVRSWLLQAVHEVLHLKKEDMSVRRTGTGKSRMIRQIVAYVEENYTRRIVLRQLAEHLSVSEGYLCRFFRENFHMTFVEYLQRVRLRKAEQLLTQTDEPVGKIALDVGYGSGNYFTTEFGKYYGVTPQKYRKGQNIEKNGQYL